MLADQIVSAANDALQRNRLVELETESINTAEISEIEHVGCGLLRFRYPGLPNDYFVPEGRVKTLRVRPPESEW
ncbi:MAG: hypothetical protein PGN21_01945 [Sphingomonas paucimobilis]